MNQYLSFAHFSLLDMLVCLMFWWSPNTDARLQGLIWYCFCIREI